MLKLATSLGTLPVYSLLARAPQSSFQLPGGPCFSGALARIAVLSFCPPPVNKGRGDGRFSFLSTIPHRHRCGLCCDAIFALS